MVLICDTFDFKQLKRNEEYQIEDKKEIEIPMWSWKKKYAMVKIHWLWYRESNFTPKQ